jgi:hypothetical protein
MPSKTDETGSPRVRLKIIGANGQEWYQQMTAVPRVGDRCTIWTNEKRIAWSGTVEDVNWCFAEDFNGAFVIVQLADRKA